MKKITAIITLGLLLLAGACQKSEYLSEGDFFYLENKEAKMPVWVKGNFDSNVMIIFVHGGPGDSGISMATTPGWSYVEEDYLMVYWDQRFSGIAQGDPDLSTMNPEQFVEDLDKLVLLIQNKYPEKDLFMCGYSWGGQLSSAYLGRDNNASKFKGWIDLDGSIYSEFDAQLMKEWILERVPEKLNESQSDEETAFWQYIVDWYEENPSPGEYTGYQPYWYISALGGDAYDWETTQELYPTPYLELIFKSMFSLSYYVYSFGNPEDIIEWDAIDCTPALANITIPTLLLWGANDGLVPPAIADYVYDHLATDPSQKEIVLLDQCGHGPHMEQPDLFYEAMKNFIETYK